MRGGLLGNRMTLKERHRLGKRFAILRGERSYVRFSEDTGVAPSLLQRYETSGGAPSLDNIIAIALAEKIRLSWLLLGRGSMKQ